MTIVVADSSLSPTEKEDKKVEKLIDKKTPKSRKYVNKRGPKYDNRKRRITEKDPDLDNTVEKNKDMSLNYKYSAHDLLSFIAVKVADSHNKPGVKELASVVQSFENDLREVSSDLADQFKAYAKFVYIDDFNDLLKSGWTDSAKEYIDIIKADRKDLQIRKTNLISTLESADLDAIADIIFSSWPNGAPSKFGEKAAVIGALKKVIKQTPLPDSLKIPFMHSGIKKAINNKEFITSLVESTRKGFGRVDTEAIPRFAQLVAAYQIVSQNPESITKESLQKGIDKLSAQVADQYKELEDLSFIMSEWHDAISQFKHTPVEKLELGKSSKDYDKVIKSLDDFMNADSKVIDLDSYKEEMEKYAKEHYGDVPDDMKSILRAATSNKEISNRNMRNRTAEYHGLVQQRANPVQTTNTGYKSYDKRYFNKNHYDSILKCAQDILDKDGWFKSGWDAGFEDASFRAALDLAIHTADDNLYQSKIDVEQYNILLNKLAKWGHDTFSDTVLPFKAGSKKEASMKPTQKLILQIANDIRNTHPKASVALLKSIRANDDEIEFSALPPEELKDVKKEMEAKIDWDATDLASFMKSFDEAFDVLQKRTASTISSLFRKIWASRSRISALHFADLDPKLVNQWIEEAKAKLDKLFTEDDVNEFMEGFEDIYSDMHKEVEKQASAVVPLGAIVQIASSNPETRAALIPFIVSQREAHIAKVKAKKKAPTGMKMKEEDKKEDKKEAESKAKAKAKKSSKKTKRKASYTPSDLDW